MTHSGCVCTSLFVAVLILLCRLFPITASVNMCKSYVFFSSSVDQKCF
uniref:Uncharacterized protein n=1 Tax=Anguilla anguilla TaxID=7936 RepID=A0A0E9X141_ANGAN